MKNIRLKMFNKLLAIMKKQYIYENIQKEKIK